MSVVKFDICSDLHLEFEWYWSQKSNIIVPEPRYYQSWFGRPKSPYLIIAGDLGVWDETEHGARAQMLLKDFHDWVTPYYKKVFYVLGNHDWWRHRLYLRTITIFKSLYPNFMVLDCFDNPVAHVKKDLYIFGTTLWSKIIRERFADTRMNDYHQIYSSDVNDDIPIEPCITNGVNEQSYKQLQSFVEGNKDKKIIVVTHHAPSYKSMTEPKTCDDAYFNQYDSWIEQQTNLVAWVHGHNHGLSDYMIGQTHVMCNPRGYIDLQPIADRFELEQLTVAL